MARVDQDRLSLGSGVCCSNCAARTRRSASVFTSPSETRRINMMPGEKNDTVPAGVACWSDGFPESTHGL
jgi:hypothetical protein